ncbi:MAG: MerR family transcriptional regulator [Firmicutes bacterium]|nr:MerR family transcriptional regulator [Bacillota bacterium]
MAKEPLNTTPVYPIGVAERLTGLTSRQLRYWESQGLVKPARTKGRQRLYSEADIARLKEIKRLLAEGMTLAQVKEYLAARERRRLPDPGERVIHLERGQRLTSLYPLSNRAELLEWIDRDDD